jgi:hypothetical protein
MTQTQAIDTTGKGEYQMVIGNLQEFFFPLADPQLLLMSLTFGTVTVAAAVVAQMKRMTMMIRTSIYMPTQSSCPTVAKGM